MPEKDFVMQRSDLSRQFDQINARLEELQASDASLPMGGKDLAMRGSYFLMLEDLVQDSYIDFERYIRTFDRAVQKSFLASSIDHIDADDGRVAAITFKNGITHRFTYKAQKRPPTARPGASSLYSRYSLNPRFLCKIRSQFGHKFYTHRPE